MLNGLAGTSQEPCRVLGRAVASGQDVDRQLLTWFLVGDRILAESAFAELVRRHGPMVLGTCRRFLPNSHDAEDAFQAVFLVLVHKAGAIQQPERLPYWLHGVAVRVARKTRARNALRARREVQELELVEPVGDLSGQERPLIGRETSELLYEELARLPATYRLPVVLCDLGGLAHAEAARRLNWPSGSLSVRLMRARELLRRRLTRRGLTASSALLALGSLAATARATVPPALAGATVRTAVAGRPKLDLGTMLSGGAPESIAAFAGQGRAALVRSKLGAGSAALIGGLIAAGLLLLGLESGQGGDSAPVATAAAGSTAPASTGTAGGAASAPVSARGSISDVAEVVGRSAADPPAPPPAISGSTSERLASYETLVKQLGRDAASQVRLALWCEGQGLEAERLKHLAQAVMIDPDQPAARGLLGQVAYRGRWRRIEDVGSLLGGDTRLAEARAAYETRRAALETSNAAAEAHWRLALWCERNGLELEARAHLVAVTRRDPARDAPWRRLGYRKSHGRWLKPERIVAETKAIEARKAADHVWRARVARWKTALQDDAKRPRVEAELARVTDPLATPAIWDGFAAQGGEGSQVVAARLLGQVDGRDASRGLALLAVMGRTAEVRRVATEILARRDPRDVIALLINSLADPIKYEVRTVQGPGLPGVLFVEGEEFNLRRVYTVPPLPEHTIRRLLDPTTPPDSTRGVAAVLGEDWARLSAAGMMGRVIQNNVDGVRRNVAVAARAAADAQQRLLDDVRWFEAHNQAVADSNERVEAPLRALTGQDYGSDGEAWRAWWTDQQGYAYVPARTSSFPKPTVEHEIPLPYRPPFKVLTGMSCFAAGTPVWTRQGQRPIESVQVGDAVLTQDPGTGALSFAPVLTVFHNKPAPTLRISLTDGGEADEPIVATGIHRFWVAGRGWTMARDLEPGDPIRTVGGRSRVAAVTPEPSQPVFNLEVENQTYFVGRAGALVHDDSLVEPVAQPFDGAADVSALLEAGGEPSLER